jgi:hypothetical protein
LAEKINKFLNNTNNAKFKNEKKKYSFGGFRGASGGNINI